MARQCGGRCQTLSKRYRHRMTGTRLFIARVSEDLGCWANAASVVIVRPPTGWKSAPHGITRCDGEIVLIDVVSGHHSWSNLRRTACKLSDEDGRDQCSAVRKSRKTTVVSFGEISISASTWRMCH